MSKSNGLHLNLQKRISGDGQVTSSSRSRSSSFCSTTSETSLKSTNSTPSSETIKEIGHDNVKIDIHADDRKTRKKDHGSNESITAHVEKAKNKDHESHKHGKHRKSDKDAKNRRNDILVYEESASNVVVQEFSILEPGIERITTNKQKKKVKSTQRKESKEQKKQQQQQQQHQVVRDTQPSLKLRDFELAESISNDNSFTKVESKAQKFLRKGNKVEPAPINNNQGYNGSLDILDEIAICGPKPDARDTGSRTYKLEPLSRTKSDQSKRMDPPQRRRSLQHVQPGTKV